MLFKPRDMIYIVHVSKFSCCVLSVDRSVQKYGKSYIKTPDNSLVKGLAFHVPFEEEESISQGKHSIFLLIEKKTPE